MRNILFISSSELLTGEANFTMLPQNWKELAMRKKPNTNPKKKNKTARYRAAIKAHKKRTIRLSRQGQRVGL